MRARTVNPVVSVAGWIFVSSLATWPVSLVGMAYTRQLSEEFRGARTGPLCRDGWRSHSAGPGTCSHHGGVFAPIYADTRGGIWEPTPRSELYQAFADANDVSGVIAAGGLTALAAYTFISGRRR